jgi:hypothetical protein
MWLVFLEVGIALGLVLMVLWALRPHQAETEENEEDL